MHLTICIPKEKVGPTKGCTVFTGLIKDIGEIISIKNNTSGKIFEIKTKLIADIKIDDSIATNGVCLTAISVKKHSFTAQAVHITLEKTSLGLLSVGSKVNLELAMRPMDRLGGHIVQGHVNALGELTQLQKRGDNYELYFKAPTSLFRYILDEGSIAIDGISLTIAQVLDNSSFKVSIIPHTYEHTTLGQKSAGDRVNLEVDILAKYVENLLLKSSDQPVAGFDWEQLRRNYAGQN